MPLCSAARCGIVGACKGSAAQPNVRPTQDDLLHGQPKTGAKEIEITDTSGGCGASFEIGLVVSDSFEGKRALQRHRLVSTRVT